MASVAPPARQKERRVRAVAAMESLGLSRDDIIPILKNLLKIYNNEWNFIEAENYRVLADAYFEQLEAQAPQSSSRGPVTRARRALSSSDDDDNLYAPEDVKPTPKTIAAIQAGRTRSANVPSPGGGDAMSPQVARGLEYHSGVSVRSRAGIQIGPSTQGGRPATNNSAAAAAAAHEKEKGKSPLVAENCRVFESRPSPSTPSKGEMGGLPNLVKVKLEVSSSLPAPGGMEHLAFEMVDGKIVPTVGRPENVGLAAKQAQQLPPLTSRVKVEGETANQQSAREQIYAPAPLQTADPGTVFTIHVKDEPVDVVAIPQARCLDKCEQAITLGNGAEHAIALKPTVQTSPSQLQIVLHCTSDLGNVSLSPVQPVGVLEGHTIDRTPEVGSEEQGGILQPVEPPDDNKLEDDEGIDLKPLVDYASDEEHPGAGCDLVLMPDEPPAEQLEPSELNGEEIRPNFILTRSSKRDVAEAEALIDAKRQKCAAEILPAPLAVQPQNGCEGRVVSEIPSAGPSTSGVKRKLILSAGACPEVDGTHRNLRSSDTHEATDDKEISDARGKGTVNVVSKRLKREPSEDRNTQCPKHDPTDISRGTEKVPIPFVNEFTSEPINLQFNYIASNVVYQHAYINISLARIGDEDFCMDCTGDCLNAPHSCPCTRETGGEFAYTQDGLLKSSYIQHEQTMNLDPVKKMKFLTYCSTECPIERAKSDALSYKCKGHHVRKFVKECWHKCGCNMRCGNRVVQRGISRQLQVFFTDNGKGWGIRAAEDLPAGAFVCEYVGEIMTNMELDQRNQDTHGQAGHQKDTYPVLLDGDWCSEKGLKDEEALCLDATKHGNVARFINHRCFDANLIDLPVTIEGLDRHYYHVAFFTNRKVRAWEELTWDYKIDFEDDEHPIEAFQCLCKSEHCRDVQAGGSRKRKK